MSSLTYLFNYLTCQIAFVFLRQRSVDRQCKGSQKGEGLLEKGGGIGHNSNLNSQSWN